MRVAAFAWSSARLAAFAGVFVWAAFAGVFVWAAFAAGAEAACATAFTEIIDVRGQNQCVPSDQARTIVLLQQQRRDARVLQDRQARLSSDQRELTRDIAREQTIRTNNRRVEQNRRPLRN